jgi:hypothetical protein
MKLAEKILKYIGLSESMTKKEHMDWYNNVFMPAIKKHSDGGIDTMMINSDLQGNVKVFTKMYKSRYVDNIKKAFKDSGVDVVEVETNASSYRGYVVGKQK